MKTTTRLLLVFAFVALVFLVSPPACKLMFYGYDAVDRSLNDPPAGTFLYEDEQVFIETGKYKTVSIGGNGDNDTYRHFIRQYLFYRDKIEMDSIRFETDPYWDDLYIHVEYKIDGPRSLSALESIKNYLYPDGQMIFTQQPEGLIIVSPPSAPKY